MPRDRRYISIWRNIGKSGFECRSLKRRDKSPFSSGSIDTCLGNLIPQQQIGFSKEKLIKIGEIDWVCVLLRPYWLFLSYNGSYVEKFTV